MDTVRQQFTSHSTRVRESRRNRSVGEVTQANNPDRNNNINDSFITIKLNAKWKNDLEVGFNRIIYDNFKTVGNATESLKLFKTFINKSNKPSLCNFYLNDQTYYKYDIQFVIQSLTSKGISKQQISRFGAATAQTLLHEWDKLVSVGLTKDNIVSISSNKGAHLTVFIILNNYSTLVAKWHWYLDALVKIILCLYHPMPVQMWQ